LRGVSCGAWCVWLTLVIIRYFTGKTDFILPGVGLVVNTNVLALVTVAVTITSVVAMAILSSILARRS